MLLTCLVRNLVGWQLRFFAFLSQGQAALLQT